jgi:hypothetical protein
MYTLYILYTSNFTNLGGHLLIKMMNETRLNDRWHSPSLAHICNKSRHGLWRDSICMSDAIFSNATVYISRSTSCGVTQLLVVPRSLTRLKGLVLRNIVEVSYF